LEAAAKAAGGTFIPANASDKATRIRGALRALRTATRTLEAREDHVPRFLWLLLPALVLLAYDSWLLTRRRSFRTSGTATAVPNTPPVVLLLLTLPVTLLSCKQAPDPASLFAEGNVPAAIAGYRAQMANGDSTAGTRYNLGTALIGADSLAAAAELLDMVRRTSEGETRMRARFNAGFAWLTMGRQPQNPEAEAALTAARVAYRALLTDRPIDADAKWNYELTLRTPPPQGGGGGGGGGGDSSNEKPDDPSSSAGGLDQKQAEALLNSAAREERDVQGRKQRQGRTPPRGKDW
jgi:Ca-activated chloride channel family protein